MRLRWAVSETTTAAMLDMAMIEVCNDFDQQFLSGSFEFRTFELKKKLNDGFGCSGGVSEETLGDEWQ
jgi:hypothetical protein